MSIYTMSNDENGLQVSFNITATTTSQQIMDAFAEVQVFALHELQQKQHKPRKVFSNFSASPSSFAASPISRDTLVSVQDIKLHDLIHTMALMKMCERIGGSTYRFVNNRTQAAYLYTVKDNKWIAPTCDEGDDGYSLLEHLNQFIWMLDDSDKNAQYRKIERYWDELTF